MADRVVKVRSSAVAACMTCPLCRKLLDEATTISLCLHTFCRKCIYDKLSDEDVDSCPVCDIDLGCSPIDKLRPDHALQSLRDKIFSQKKKKTEAVGTMPPVTPPTKRKERSLSSLVTPPRVFIQNALTGRRTKVTARRVTSYHSPGSPFGGSPKNEELNKDQSTESILAESPLKSCKGMESSPSESTEEQKPAKDDKKADEAEGKSDLWTPLHCLVEAANRTKSSKGLSFTKSEPHSGSDKGPHVPELQTKAEAPDAPDLFKIKSKDQAQKGTPQDNKKGSPSRPIPVKRKRLRLAGQKKAGSSGESGASAQCLVDVSGGNPNRKNRPIWFTLIASENQKEQISPCYLRILDGNVPVSVIQKYIVHKLHLKSEAEVEIMCRGQPVLPSLHLHNLIDIWSRTAGSTIGLGLMSRIFLSVTLLMTVLIFEVDASCISLSGPETWSRNRWSNQPAE
ncbi:hypothetical protein MLD38_016415 [Melastoma candidum]|uniref:Uncharacterized protein n=1 Tax=Melastoma candidum TaxID=119954 RepID=A0ACB9RJ24_9MYRT|nr:hypothetical protein MLD38_016415 [Melastoma candidum]